VIRESVEGDMEEKALDNIGSKLGIWSNLVLNNSTWHIMKNKIIDTLRLKNEQESFTIVRKSIEDGAVFSGTNLWVLFFAILIASLGLNVNSTAVVIGAMLISPLMGPIIAIGASVAIKDLNLLRKAVRNYLFAAAVGLTASTIYFLLSPINEAYTEILARTQPTVYDVLIAFFGGFAGIIALSSKQKGNVLPGAAIATALMPPLCTAGFGLATGQFTYFFGALYLYLINTVFIAAATILTAYFLKFPVKKYEDPDFEHKAKNIVWAVIILTLLPSIYLGYDLVQQNEFKAKSKKYIETECILPNDYLLKKEIDAKNKTITLTYGGQVIADSTINSLKDKLKYYGLEGVTVVIKQGFSILEQDTKFINNAEINQLGLALKQTEAQRLILNAKLDSINNQQLISQQLFKEMKVQYPGLKEAVIQPVALETDTTSSQQAIYLVFLDFNPSLPMSEQTKLEKWLKVRLNKPEIKLVFQ